MTPAAAEDVAVDRGTVLSEAKRTLLERRLRGRSTAAGISRIAPGQPAPLASAQERLWFLNELQPGSAVYHIPVALRLKGRLNVEALRRALQDVVLRHDVLRTRLQRAEGAMVQIADAPSPVLGETDLRGLPGAERETALGKLLADEIRRPFNFTEGPLLRAALIRVDERDHALCLVLHHIVSDGWSVGVLLRELGEAYDAAAAGKPAAFAPLPIRYADYAAWQRSGANAPALDQQRAYWKKRLAGAPALLQLPADRPRPALATFRGGVVRRALPRALIEAVSALSRAEGATPFMTLLAAFNALLFRLTGEGDLVVAVPAAGRTQPQTEGLVGLFVNTLALRSELSDDPAFRSLLQRVKAGSLDALLNQDFPFDQLVGELRPDRGAGHSPLAQAMFTFQESAAASARFAGLTAEAIDVDPGTSRLDLTLVAEPIGGSIHLSLEYSSDLFDQATAERLLGQYETLLADAAANPDRRLSELGLLTASERRQLLVDWNRTQQPFPAGRCLHELFEAQVRATPRATALVAGAERLSYAELDRRAERIARYLRSAGVGAESRVAVFLERSALLVAGILGVLKAGAAYVPMDPAYPADRLSFILEDCGAALVLTQSSLQARLPASSTKSVCAEQLPTTLDGAAAAICPVNERDLAYVIYTSGSTGRPKGVALEHRQAAAFVHWAGSAFSPRQLGGVLAATSICFDLSIFELFAPLSVGGKIVLADNALALAGLAARDEVSLLNTVPSAAAELLRLGAIPASVETINLAGEPLPQELVELLYALPGVREVRDLYGPTETTTYSTMALRKPGGRPTIGRPIANTEIYLLDRRLQPVPAGVAGEMYIGGAGLARGYLNRPQLTQERFVPHPFSADPTARLYRTGDIARYRSNGEIEYLGRADDQVKIRGFRIELGEVEAALRTHPEVTDAVAAASGSGAERQLVAYVVARAGTLDHGALREHLRSHLPEPLVPTAWVTLERIPRTANGKVDRRALPAPQAVRSPRAIAAPRDELETQISACWEAVLRSGPVGIHDRFFDLGGHSLLAVRLTARLERELGRKVGVATLLQAPTVAQLADQLRAAESAPQERASRLLAIQPKGNQRPLFLVHGMGGDLMWGYANLSRHLGEDQPVYAFKAKEPDEGPADTVEEMARCYVEEMRLQQPAGPYRIGGYCFGGNVAYEMARVLEAQGETVELLALISCWPANSPHTRFHWTPRAIAGFLGNLIHWASRMRGWEPESRRQFFRWKGRTLGRRFMRLLRADDPRENDIHLFVDLAAIPPSERLLWKAHLSAINRYHPKPYNGRVVLLRTLGCPLLCSFDRAQGWDDLAKGGVDIRMLPGLHETLMSEPHVAALGTELSRQLAAGESAADGEADERAVSLPRCLPAAS